MSIPAESVKKGCTNETHCSAEFREVDESETPFCSGCNKTCPA